MKKYIRIDNTSKFSLVVGLIVLMIVISACGNPTTVSLSEADDAQVVATETPSSESTLEVSLPTSAPTEEQARVASAPSLSYSKDVYPIFEASCIKCHGVEKVSRGLDLTSYEKTMTGSIKGPVVLPGDAENSLLVKLTVEGKMPKQGAKLTPEQVEIVRNWVSQGAPNN